MKRIITILILILLSNGILKAQSSAVLDEKNGFKDIKLGDSYDKWKLNLKYLGTYGNNENLYSYTGSCCQNAFNIPVERIEIVFANNIITYIAIYLKPFQDNRATGDPARFRFPNDDFVRLNLDLQSLFGEGKDGAPSESEGLFYSKVYAGKKVALIADYYFKGTYDFCKIIVFDKIYSDKKKQSGF